MAEEYTATDFNGLPSAGGLQDTDVIPLQRGTGVDSTKQTTFGAIKAAAVAAVPPSSSVSVVMELTGASASLGLTHAGNFVKCNHTAAQTITIPPQATVAWSADTQIEGAQWGAGAVTFVGGSGVTVRKRSNRSMTTAGQYAPWALKRVAENEWMLTGDLGSA
jgi:hypothetical protein